MATIDSSRHSLPEDKFPRPVSAYDNLNGTRSESKKCRASLDESCVRRSNGGFPYTEITFKFGDIPRRAVESRDVMSPESERPGSEADRADKSQYVNLSEAVQSDELREKHKASISTAKSNFFGLNGTSVAAEDKGVVPRRRIRLKMDDEEEDSEEYGEETVKLLPEIVSTFNSSATPSNSYQNVPRNHKFQHQVSYVQEMKLVESSSSSDPGKSEVVPRTKTPSPDTNSHRLSQPSQTVYMATTVPQNMKPAQITGRHVPTRSSLRHSRMLVVNKNFKDTGKPNPLNLRHPKWGKFFMVLEIISGIMAVGIGLWLLLWAPSTRLQDNPYWCGLILIISGSFGCSLMDFKRAPRSKSREMCFRVTKIIFSVGLVVATLTSLLATLFASVHLGALSASSTNCLPSNIFTVSSTCVCLFGRRNETTDHLEILKHTNGDAHEDDKAVANTGGTEFHYRDLNCREVEGPFRYILMGSIVTNLVGFASAASVLIMYWTGRRQRRRLADGVSPGITQLPE